MKPAASCALLLACLSVIGEEAPLDVVPKLVKGQSWKVEQTVEVRAALPKRAGGPNTERPRVNSPVTLKEAWTDTAIEELGAGTGTVKRAWTEAKTGPEPSTLVGTELTLTAAEKDRTTVALRKGKPGDEAVLALGKAPIEAVGLLRAGRAIQAGETWTVPAAVVASMLRALAAGFGGAGPVAKGQTAGLQTFLKGEGEVAWLCEVKATVKDGAKKGELVIDLAGQRGDGSASTEIKGSLAFDGARRRPSAFSLTITRSLRANDELETDGFTETWVVTKTWK
ncbi:MAG: hypothetical protein HUU15_01880 [Candidatus Brocadiae bacterium]|nr:hypothetical protein [Candidatus Brocadiia bacterium]